MKITLNELFAADEALHVLDEAKTLPAKIKYRVGKVVDQLIRENDLIAPRRVEILERIGAVEKEGQPGKYEFANLEKTLERLASEGLLPDPLPEALPAEFEDMVARETKADADKRRALFVAEVDDLLTETVEVHVLLIPLEALERVPEFTAKHMRSAFWLIEEESDKEQKNEHSGS